MTGKVVSATAATKGQDDKGAAKVAPAPAPEVDKDELISALTDEIEQLREANAALKDEVEELKKPASGVEAPKPYVEDEDEDVSEKKLYRLGRPFWNGRVKVPKGECMYFAEGKAPKTAKLV